MGNHIIECETDYYKYQTSAPYLNQFVDILKTDLDKLVEEYTEILTDRYRGDCSCDSVDKWQLWSQRYTKGQYHGAHNHGLMNISCVLYVEFDDKLHFPTTFYSPFPNPIMEQLTKLRLQYLKERLLHFPLCYYMSRLLRNRDTRELSCHSIYL